MQQHIVSHTSQYTINTSITITILILPPPSTHTHTHTHIHTNAGLTHSPMLQSHVYKAFPMSKVDDVVLINVEGLNWIHIYLTEDWVCFKHRILSLTHASEPYGQSLSEVEG